MDKKGETTDETENAQAENAAYGFFRDVLHSPRYILAPMVEQSELAFRQMLREYGTQLCYTPMWHAGIFIKDEAYRKVALDTCAKDRPLIVQFCANDPAVFAHACELAEPYCDAIDLNLGCPQVIAKRGHYGAYLMEEVNLIESMVRTATARINKPITVKIRRCDTLTQTVEYAQRLESAGAKMIAVHGRTRAMRGPLTGMADWDHIKAVKQNVSVPVIANGNIQYLRDVHRCIEYTGVDGVMSAEGCLYNPALFTGRQPPAWEPVLKYLEHVDRHPCSIGWVRGHLFRMLHHILQKHEHMRHHLGTTKTLERAKEVVNEILDLARKDVDNDKANSRDSEEPGHIPYWRCQPYIRPTQEQHCKKRKLDTTADMSADVSNATTVGTTPVNERGATDEHKSVMSQTPTSTNQQKKEVERLRGNELRKLKQQKKATNGKGLFGKTPVHKWPLCGECTVNPWSNKCQHQMCKACCKRKQLQCEGHTRKRKANKTVAAEEDKGGDYGNFNKKEKETNGDHDDENNMGESNSSADQKLLEEEESKEFDENRQA